MITNESEVREHLHYRPLRERLFTRHLGRWRPFLRERIEQVTYYRLRCEDGPCKGQDFWLRESTVGVDVPFLVRPPQVQFMGEFAQRVIAAAATQIVRYRVAERDGVRYLRTHAVAS